MRLTFKFLAAMAVCLVAVLSVDACRRAERDHEAFQADEARDALLVAQNLARSAGLMWDRADAAAAQRLVGRGGGTWVWQGEDRPGDPRQRVKEGQLETIVPIPDTFRAAVVMKRPVTPPHSHMRRRVIDAAWLGAGLFVTLVVVTLLLGQRLVTRPARALVAKARRVAAGDLDGPLAVTQNDELGDLAREMNAMCDGLRAARKSEPQKNDP
jgi:methyl-accepting chemotaxis protein